jgi:hypothetical protein
MNLETIEEQVLKYLAQTSNPLVRIEVLHAHLRDSGVAEELELGQLKDFLSRHELVRVMDPPVQTESSSSEPGGAYAILATRIPTPQQLGEMMFDQLAALESALLSAKAQALELGDPARTGPIEVALLRVAALRERLSAPPVDPKNN